MSGKSKPEAVPDPCVPGRGEVITGPCWNFQLRETQPPERTFSNFWGWEGTGRVDFNSQSCRVDSKPVRTLIKWDFPSIPLNLAVLGAGGPACPLSLSVQEKAEVAKPSPGPWNE